MKISAIPVGGTPGIDIGSVSMSADKKAAAKAAFEGVKMSPSDTPVDEKVEKSQANIRTIKMKTNVSPDRFDATEVTQQVDSAKPDVTEQTNAVIEDTKPLSPQAAALAKARRALQVKERELADREKALESKTTGSSEDLVARLKSQPLSVLQEHGVTYDQLTEAILADSSGLNPAIQELKAEIKALKEGVDKNLSERDSQAEQQVLRQIRKEAEQLAREGDTFELVREERAVPDVIRLIHETYKKHGEVLDTSEAMQLVEDELLKDNLRRANFKKIQSKLTPSQPQQQAPQAQRQNQIRTLTNRDSSTVPLSRRERALLAFQGNLKRG
jgi:hypothetical protein